jgi:hypothetical protein
MANVGVFTVNQIELIEGPSRYPGLATIEATLKAKGIVFSTAQVLCRMLPTSTLAISG